MGARCSTHPEVADAGDFAKQLLVFAGDGGMSGGEDSNEPCVSENEHATALLQHVLATAVL